MIGTTVSALKVGDRAVFDVVYGAETLTEATPLTLPNGVKCLHMSVQADDRKSGRYVVRASHEPVILVDG